MFFVIYYVQSKLVERQQCFNQNIITKILSNNKSSLKAAPHLTFSGTSTKNAESLMYLRECDEFHGVARHVVAVYWQKSLINQETIISILYKKQSKKYNKEKYSAPSQKVSTQG